MSFGTDIYGSPFGAPDVEPIDAIAYAQGVVLYVADDFVEDGYTVDPIEVNVSTPAVLAIFTRSVDAQISAPTVSVSAAEPTLTVTSTAHTQGELQYLPNGYLPDGYFKEPQRVIVSAPVVTAGQRVTVVPLANETYADVDYVRPDYFDDTLVLLSVTPSEPTARIAASVTVGAIPAVTATVSEFSLTVDAAISAAAGTVSVNAPIVSVSASATISTSATESVISSPSAQVNLTTSVSAGDVALSPAESSATGDAVATFGALLVDATAPSVTPSGTALAFNLPTIAVTSSPSASATGDANESPLALDPVYLFTPSVYEIATEYPNAIPHVIVSAPEPTLSVSDSVDVVVGTITTSSPVVTTAVVARPNSDSVSTTLPVVSPTGGTGVTAFPEPLEYYVDENYWDLGYTVDPLAVIVAATPVILASVSDSGSAALPEVTITTTTATASGDAVARGGFHSSYIAGQYIATGYFALDSAEVVPLDGFATAEQIVTFDAECNPIFGTSSLSASADKLKDVGGSIVSSCSVSGFAIDVGTGSASALCSSTTSATAVSTLIANANAIGPDFYVEREYWEYEYAEGDTNVIAVTATPTKLFGAVATSQGSTTVNSAATIVSTGTTAISGTSVVSGAGLRVFNPTGLSTGESVVTAVARQTHVVEGTSDGSASIDLAFGYRIPFIDPELLTHDRIVYVAQEPPRVFVVAEEYTRIITVEQPPTRVVKVA